MAVTDKTTRYPKATAAADVLQDEMVDVGAVIWYGSAILANDELILTDAYGKVWFDYTSVTAKAGCAIPFNKSLKVYGPTVSQIPHGTVMIHLV